MIAHLSGKILIKTAAGCIFCCNNIGYELELPARILELFSEGDSTQFFVYTHVREDQLKLYGFESLLERDMFTTLLTISGVGPKAALMILSAGNVEKISQAISQADVNFFVNIKGLGKKTAQKIIIELKEKLGSLQELDLNTDTVPNFSQEVIDALRQLGFVQKDIIAVLSDIDNSLEEPEIIKIAIQKLGR